jgi:hypothetical protein
LQPEQLFFAGYRDSDGGILAWINRFGGVFDAQRFRAGDRSLKSRYRANPDNPYFLAKLRILRSP